MGSPSPVSTKLKEGFTTKAGPHRRSPSVTSCISLESEDKDVQSLAKSNEPGRSPVASTSSRKRRSLNGGSDDLARGLDFSSTTGSPPVEEKKHPFLAKGGGHKSVARPASPGIPSNSPGKKTSPTPLGKERVLGRSPVKKSDGSKKDTISPPRPVLASEELSINAIMNSNSELGNNAGSDSLAEEATSNKSSPRVSLDGKLRKSSPRHFIKSKSDLATTKGRTNSNGDQIEEAKSNKSSPRVSLDGKLRKSSPRPSQKSGSDLVPSKGKKSTINLQDAPSPQPGRIMRQIDIAARNEELSRPELESVEVPVYSENECEKKVTSEDVDIMLHKMPGSLQHGEVGGDGSTLLSSTMDSGDVGLEKLSSLEQGNERGLHNDNELSTSWLTEDLPYMFSSLSHLPEPDDSSSSLLGDPSEVGGDGSTLLSSTMDSGDVGMEKLSSLEQGHERGQHNGNELSTSWLTEDLSYMFSSLSHLPEPDDSSSSLLGDPSEVLDEPFLMEAVNIMRSSDESIIAIPIVNDNVAAEVPRNLLVYSVESPVTTLDPVDKIEADQFGTHEDADTHDRELQQTLVPLFVEEYVVPDVAGLQSLPTLDKDEATPCKIISTHLEGVSGFISANESSVSENVAHEAFLQNIQPTLSQNCKDPTEFSQELAQFLEGEKGIYFLEPPSCSEDLSKADARPTLQEEGRPAEDKIISAPPCSLDVYVVESNDDETLKEIINDSISESSADETLEESIEDLDSVQLNLKQSFDGVAEPLLDSQSKVDEIALDKIITSRERALHTEEIISGVTKLTESESPAESLDAQVYRTFTPTHLIQDTITFEEFYWTQNIADESSQSNSGQNDAEDLHPNSSASETQVLNVVQQVTEKSLPPIELPVSILPVVGKLKFTVEEPIGLEPLGQSSPQMGASKLYNYQTGMESANQEEPGRYAEVFHLFKESKELSTAAVLSDNSSSPSSPILLQGDLNQEPPKPLLTGCFEETRFDNIAGEFDSNYLSPRNTSLTQETEHSYLVDTGKGKEMEGETKPGLVAGNLEGSVDQEPYPEHLDTSPILAVISNGLLNVNIQQLDDSAAIDDSVKSELSIENADLSSTREDASHKSSSETPAEPDACYVTLLSDDILDLDLETLSMQNGLEIGAIGVQTEETVDRADAEILVSDDCLLEAPKQVDPLESNTEASLLPPGDTITKEELITEAMVSSSLDNVESPYGAFHNVGHVDSAPSLGAMHIIFDQEVPESGPLNTLERAAFVKENSDCISGGIVTLNSSEPGESFQSTGSETREDEIEVAGHGSVDGSITTPGHQTIVESYKDVNVSDTDTPQLPLLSTPSSEIMKACTEDGIQGFVTRDSADNSKPEVNSSALLGQAIAVGTDTVIQIREKDEATYIVSEPVVLSARELPDGSLNKVGELNGHIELECNVEEKPRNEANSEFGVVDFEEQSASAARGCEGSLPAEPVVLTARELPDGSLNEVGELNRHIEVECNVEEKPRNEANSEFGVVDFEEQSASAVRGCEGSLPAEPVVLTARELPDGSLNEVGELNRHIEVECNVEEKPRNEANSEFGVTDFEEQSASAVRGCEGSLPADDRSGLMSSPEDKMDQVTEVTIFTNASSSVVADESDTAIETEKVSMTSLDTAFDEDLAKSSSNDDAVNNMEILSGSAENCSAQDLLIKLDSDPSSAGLDVDDIKDHSDFSWKSIKEIERLYGSSLEGESLHEDKETIFDNMKKSFIVSGQDTAILDDDDMEKHSNSSWKADKEEESLIIGPLVEEAVLEFDEDVLEFDEDVVVYNPKTSFVVSGQDSLHTTTLGHVNDIQNNSNLSWTADKDEESLDGSLEEDDEDTVVYKPFESITASSQDAPNTADFIVDKMEKHSNSPGKVDTEGESLIGSPVEESTLEVESIVVDSPREPLLASGQDSTTANAAILNFDDTEEHPTRESDKEVGLNGSLKEEDSVFDVEDTQLDRLSSNRAEMCCRSGCLVEELVCHHSQADDGAIAPHEVEINQTVLNPVHITTDACGADPADSLVVQTDHDDEKADALDELPRPDAVELKSCTNDIEEHPTRESDKEGGLNGSLKEEDSVFDVEDTQLDRSSSNRAEMCCRSGCLVEELVCHHSQADDGAIAPHEVEINQTVLNPVHITTDACGADPADSLVVQTDHDDEKADALDELPRPDAVELKSCTNDIEEHPTRESYKEGGLNGSLKEVDSVLEVEDTQLDSSSGNVDNDEMYSRSGCLVEELVCHHSQLAGDGVIAPHENHEDEINQTVYPVDTTTDACNCGAGLADNSLVVQTDHVDEKTDALDELTRPDVVELKSCTNDIRNGEQLHDFDCLNGTTVALVENPDSVVKQTGSNLVISTLQDSPINSQDTPPEETEPRNTEEHPTRESDKEVGLNGSLKEEDSALEVEDTQLGSSSGNVDNDKMYSRSGSLVEELVFHPEADDGQIAPHETHGVAEINQTVNPVHITTDRACGAKLADSLVVQTDHVDEKTALDELSRPDAVELKSCTVEITNGKQLRDSDCLNGATALIENPGSVVEQTGSNLVMSTLQGAPIISQDSPSEVDTEPRSPAATLHPHLEQPPFSGPLQDRLWEEQAEAYSSGGRGTPTRNDQDIYSQATFRSPSPGLEPTSSDDHIQPASGRVFNNGHAVVGASNGDEQKGNGKGKLHTPLRSLLLEDAHKSSAIGDSNGAGTHSPSFIRRLFRVKSTPASSRSSPHADKDDSPAKLKKSSSMWVSCLGSPQVHQ